MGKTVIYSTITCPYCRRAKDYLNSKNIEFEEIDVSKDKHRLKEMIEKSGQMGVPVIEINGNIIVGFNKKEIDQHLRDMESKN
ncbi:MAG: glutaredoxin domain-containing protein [Candidatus Humimicrobiaceae bacterium]